MKTVIRDMTRVDVPRVGELLFEAFSSSASRHGYAPRLQTLQEATSWAWAILRHGRGDHLLVAEVAGRTVGICCLNERGRFGGIGPVAVAPAFQGQGVGRQLMRVILERAEGLQSVRLFQEAFNVASFSMYYSMGFMPVADLLDLSAAARPQGAPPISGRVDELRCDELDSLESYDHQRSGVSRRRDLEYFLKWGKVFVQGRGSDIRGFLACLPAAQSVQFGPLVADGEEEAILLYHKAAAAFREKACQTRVMARNRALVESLQSQGFRLYCLNLLMVRGSWRPGKSVGAFGRFPEGL